MTEQKYRRDNIMEDAAERAWKWVFEFKVDPKKPNQLDEASCTLFDQKLAWLMANETDDNILRTITVLISNTPSSHLYGSAFELFHAKFGELIINGSLQEPWRAGYPRPDWAKSLTTPKETSKI